MSTNKIAGALVAAALASTSLLTACGSDDKTDDKTGTPQSSVSSPADPTPSVSATDEAPQVDGLTLAPGAVGPVKVGMTKAEAAATGLFDTDVPAGASGCDAEPLAWKAPYADVLDVQTLTSGEVASIGVHEAGPTTADGLGVGSTLADVLAAHPGSKAVPAGYGQTGVLVQDATTDGWIGYLFDVEPAKAQDGDTVSFIELTAGEKPSVMRDGC